MDKFLERVKHIHKDCNLICKQTIGKYLPVAGNIGIFCQNESEYKDFLDVKNTITKSSHNPNQKYFELIEPIIISGDSEIPESTYTYLYIRKPDPTPYGKYLGDIDFVLENDAYESLKQRVITGTLGDTVVLYDRPGWDTIQVTSPDVTSVAYISTKEFAEKVRVKFD